MGGRSADDALTAIVRKLYPSDKDYILVEPFRTVSNGSQSFRVVDLRYDTADEVRVDASKAWLIYSLMIRAAITTTPAGNRIAFVGGGVAAVSTAVGFLVEDGLKRGMDRYVGDLEQVRRDLARKYPDSFTTAR